METECKIERKIRMRFDDGMHYCFIFIISLTMIILSYDMWKDIFKDSRIFLTSLIILFVLIMLFYLLDTAIWRFGGIESVEITPLYVRYTQKRLINRVFLIKIKDIISIKKNDKAKHAKLSIEEDGGRLSITFRRSFLCFSLNDEIDIGSQFSDCEIDKLLSVYSNVKALEEDRD